MASRRDQAEAARGGRFAELVDAVFPVLVDADNVERPDLRDFWRTMALEIGQDAFIRQLEAATGRPDSRPDLGAISCPSAVVHGVGDRLIPSENGVEAAAAIPGARLTLVPDAGHMLAQEQPEALASAVAELLPHDAHTVDRQRHATHRNVRYLCLSMAAI